MPPMQKFMVLSYSVVMFLVAAGLRTWNLTLESPGFEEIVCSMAAMLSPLEYLHEENKNLCPALYYIILRPFALMREGHLGFMRLPSILIGSLTPVLVYFLGRRLLPERAAMLAGFFMAVNPLHIYFSQEVQPAAIFTAVAVIAFYYLVRSGETNQPRHWALYDVASIAMLHLHSEAVFFVVAFFLLHLLKIFFFRNPEEQRRVRRGRLLATTAFNYVIIVCVSLPWLTIMPSRMPWFEQRPAAADLISMFSHSLMFGALGRMPVTLYLAVGLLFLMLVPPLLKLLRKAEAHAITVVCALLLVAILPFAYSYIGRVRFGTLRTAILITPMLALSLGVLLGRCNFYVRAVLFGLFTSVFLFATTRQALTAQKVDYQVAAREFKHNAKKGDLAVFWPDYTRAIGEYFLDAEDHESISATELFKKRGDSPQSENVYFFVSQLPHKEAHLHTFPGALRQYAKSQIIWRDRLNMVIKASDLNMFNLKLWYDDPETLSILDIAIPNVTQFMFTTADPLFRNDHLFHFNQPDICFEIDGRRVVWTKTRYTDMDLTVTLAPGNYVLKLHCSPDVDLPEHNLLFDRKVQLELRSGERAKRVALEKEMTIQLPFDTDVELQKLPLHLDCNPLLELDYPRKLALGIKIYSISIDLATNTPGP